MGAETNGVAEKVDDLLEVCLLLFITKSMLFSSNRFMPTTFNWVS